MRTVSPLFKTRSCGGLLPKGSWVRGMRGIVKELVFVSTRHPLTATVSLLESETESTSVSALLAEGFRVTDDIRTFRNFSESCSLVKPTGIELVAIERRGSVSGSGAGSGAGVAGRDCDGSGR